MELKIGTKTILIVLHVISWMIFVGLCIETCGIIFNSIYAMYKPTIAAHFWNGADLSALYNFDKGHFLVQMSLISIASIMKALIFYIIIKMFYDKKLSLEKPFDPNVTSLVFLIAYICLGAGIFSIWGVNYSNWLKGQNIPMPDAEFLRIGGGDVWLFIAVILAIVGQVFKKGTALQSEIDLTV
jgi:Protein of unknown function (DUF2975)